MGRGGTGLLLVGLTACGGGAPADPQGTDDWGATTRTQQGRYRVAMAFEPTDPPLGELFSARATITDPKGEPVEDATVTLDALMPQHGHGMETRPQVDPGECGDDGERCRHPGGVYVARGFKFHMPGAWTVTVDIGGPAQDNATFIYEME